MPSFDMHNPLAAHPRVATGAALQALVAFFSDHERWGNSLWCYALIGVHSMTMILPLSGVCKVAEIDVPGQLRDTDVLDVSINEPWSEMCLELRCSDAETVAQPVMVWLDAMMEVSC
jgi:hypothetical protein